jgi:osmotically-inducible protein OsmY
MKHAIRVLLFALALMPAFGQGTPQDDRLYDEIRRKLANDRDVGGEAIDVQVKGGKVVLNGAVKNEKNRVKVEKVVRKAKGVTDVENKLTVRIVAGK